VLSGIVRLDRKPFEAYLIAAIALLVATAVRVVLMAALGPFSPFAIFTLAVMAASVAGGLGPGLFATASGLVIGQLLFIEPVGSISLEPTQVAVTLVFAVIGIGISVLGHSMLKALRTAETERHRLQTVLHGLPVGVIISNARGALVEANSEAGRIWGGSIPIGAGIPSYARFHGWWSETGKALAAEDWAMARALKNGESSSGELIDIERFDGSRGTIVNAARPLYGPSGRVSGAVVTFLDITELRQAQHALRESYRDYEAMFDLSGVGMVWLEPRTLRLRRVNRRFCAIAGYECEELTGMALSALTHPSDREADAARYEQLLRGTADTQFAEKRYVRKDGTIAWVATAVTLIRRDGQPHNLVAMVQDITASRLAEQRLQELNRTLEQRVATRTRELTEINSELEAFGYSVSHDLRAPLRALEGFSDALIEDFGGKMEPRAVRYAQRIANAASRMDRLIEDLLAYSRLSRQQVERQRVDLDALVGAILEDRAPTIERLGGRVEVHRPLGHASGNRAVLSHVITNLLDNALKFVPAGRAPRVALWSGRDGGRLRLFIEDNGIGIAPGHQQQIFRVFERLHGDTTYPGTGIGLAIVKKGMERIGGDVGVSSAPGQGSRFWIEVEAAEVPNERSVTLAAR
jgi:PAS domain S-box-containing protein